MAKLAFAVVDVQFAAAVYPVHIYRIIENDLNPHQIV
jgi:hypothetical protein